MSPPDFPYTTAGEHTGAPLQMRSETNPFASHVDCTGVGCYDSGQSKQEG